MATLRVTQIQRIVADRGEPDATPHSPGGFFLEIRFDEPGRPRGPVGPEFQNKVLTVDSAFGNVVIQFDEAGQLWSLDLS
jgi:hypothetical protein